MSIKNGGRGGIVINTASMGGKLIYNLFISKL